jgi:hypothetical protein
MITPCGPRAPKDTGPDCRSMRAVTLGPHVGMRVMSFMTGLALCIPHTTLECEGPIGAYKVSCHKACGGLKV